MFWTGNEGQSDKSSCTQTIICRLLNHNSVIKVQGQNNASCISNHSIIPKLGLKIFLSW